MWYIEVTHPQHETISNHVSFTFIQNQPRRRFNRSLTEVRPDAYIFDDGLHFEVRPLPEEDEMLKSHETLNEPKQMRARKISSVLSEDSEIYPNPKLYVSGSASVSVTNVPHVPPEIVETVSSPKPTRSPFLSSARKVASSESKDTLTPVEGVDDHTLVENDDDGSVENIMELNFESARQRALRRRSMGRRCSDQHCSSHDLNKSQTSLCRRQLSLTQSEPDSGNEGELIELFFFVTFL